MKALLRASAISCVVMGSGDIICQLISATHEKKELDWAQSARFALAGATLHGPYFLYGFRLVDRIPLHGVHTALGRSVSKTLVTQVTVFPLYVALLYVYLGVLEGLSREQIENKVITAWPYTYAVGTAFWPVANIANFL